MVSVAQLVRAPRCGRGGRGFESPRSPFRPSRHEPQSPARCRKVQVRPFRRPWLARSFHPLRLRAAPDSAPVDARPRTDGEGGDSSCNEADRGGQAGHLPMATVKPIEVNKVKAGQRKRRPALSVDEVRRLLAAAAAGVAPNVLKQIGRHASITTTMQHYTHLFRDDEAHAIAKLPDLYVTETLQATAGTDEASREPARFQTSAPGPHSTNTDDSTSRSTPGRDRTCDLPLRRRLLYPTELRAQRGQW